MSNINDKALDVLAIENKKTCIECIEKATFDKTIQGHVMKILPDNRYEVEIGRARYPTYSINDMSYKFGDTVWLIAPQNNFSDIFIIGKKRY